MMTMDPSALNRFAEFYAHTFDHPFVAAMSVLDRMPVFGAAFEAAVLGAFGYGLARARRAKRWLLLSAAAAAFAFSPVILCCRTPVAERFPAAAAKPETDDAVAHYLSWIAVRADACPPADLDGAVDKAVGSLLRTMGERPLLPQPELDLSLRTIRSLFGDDSTTDPWTRAYYVNDIAPGAYAQFRAHELFHVNGYLLDRQADALACLALLNADDRFLQLAGGAARLGFDRVPLPSRVARFFIERPAAPASFSHAYRLVMDETQGTGRYSSQPGRIMRDLEKRLGYDGVAALTKPLKSPGSSIAGKLAGVAKQ